MNDLKSRCDELLNYDPETGIFTRKVARGKARAGSVAGYVHPSGYLHICIDGKYYRAHRLAFLVSHGYLPEFIDHINGDPSDNRIANLRPATKTQNNQNRCRNANNTSGFKGVHFHKAAGKWNVQISENGRLKYLGLFELLFDAVQTYNAKAMRIHGEFYCEHANI